MSSLMDVCKFTREISRQANKTGDLPKPEEFNVAYAEKYLKKNRRYAAEISTAAQSEKYSLISIQHGYYNLTLNGYNIIKGIPFVRPGLILFAVNELNTPVTWIISLLALGVSIVALVL